MAELKTEDIIKACVKTHVYSELKNMVAEKSQLFGLAALADFFGVLKRTAQRYKSNGL